MKKSEFILSRPNNSAAEIVAEAKKAGMKISTAYVYTARSQGKGKTGNGDANLVKSARKGSTASIEQQFASLALDIGLARSAQLLESARKSAYAAI